MPEIAIDARFLGTGLGTYILNVLRNMDSRGNFRLRAIVRHQDVVTLSPYCDDLRVVNAGMYSISEQILVATAAKGADLFHATHYNVPLAHRGEMLVTIHDLTHILDRTFSKTIKSLFYARPMLRLAACRAAHIVTVSEYSKANIVEFIGVREEKISVIPNGVDKAFHPAEQATALGTINKICEFSGPYLLYLGNLKPHKNVNGLLRAFKLLVSEPDFDYKLLIVGDDSVERPALMKLAVDLKLNGRVVFIRRIDQRYVRELYNGATVTVLPSFEEGFGLPVLESMACGTPVACANAASLPEVGGDAVEYFDPGRAESIAYSIERLLSSSDLRDELRCRGIARAEKFSWVANGRAHLALYKALTS